TPLHGDDEDVVAAVAVGTEGEPFAVRAEDGVDIMGLVEGDGPRDAADGFDDPDVAEVAEGDELAVGRDIGGAGETDGLLRGSAGGEKARRDHGGQDETQTQHDGSPC